MTAASKSSGAKAKAKVERTPVTLGHYYKSGLADLKKRAKIVDELIKYLRKRRAEGYSEIADRWVYELDRVAIERYRLIKFLDDSMENYDDDF